MGAQRLVSSAEVVAESLVPDSRISFLRMCDYYHERATDGGLLITEAV